MTIKQFTTAAKSVEGKTETASPVELEFEERKITFNGPSESQIAMLLVGSSDTVSGNQALSTTINFFFSLLEDDDQRYFKVRLLDRDDPFDVEDIVAMLNYLMEEWSATPTKPASDSTSSPPKTGHKSTHKRSHMAVASTS